MPSDPLKQTLRSSAVAYASYLLTHRSPGEPFNVVALVSQRFNELSGHEAIQAVEAAQAGLDVPQLAPGRSIEEVPQPSDHAVDPGLREGYRYLLTVTVADRNDRTVTRSMVVTSANPLSFLDLENEAIEWAATNLQDSPVGGAGGDQLRGPFPFVGIDVNSAHRAPSEF